MSIQRDAFLEACSMARRALADHGGLLGYGTIVLTDGDGQVISAQPFTNLITDVGDAYYAAKAITGTFSNGVTNSAPTIMAHMKLGTSTTAASKASTGAAIVTTIASSSTAFDATYPSSSNLGAGLGVNAVYKTTWAAGASTNSAITEAVISSDTSTGAGSAANTISRVVFTAVNKGASDTLAITWNHKFLGA